MTNTPTPFSQLGMNKSAFDWGKIFTEARPPMSSSTPAPTPVPAATTVGYQGAKTPEDISRALAVGNSMQGPVPGARNAPSFAVPEPAEEPMSVFNENKAPEPTPQKLIPDTPAAPSGPSSDHLAMFRRGTASKFDPNSRLDKAKMDALMRGTKGWADNKAARTAMNASRMSKAAGLKEILAASKKSLQLPTGEGAAGKVNELADNVSKSITASNVVTKEANFNPTPFSLLGQ